MVALTDPLKIKGLSLRNRLVVPPMVTGLANGGIPSEAQLGWYGNLARSGAALVIVEAASVLLDAQILPRQIDVSPDTPLAPLASLAQAIQRNGTPAILQIVHGGGRSHRPELAVPRVAPSAVAIAPGPKPRALMELEIEKLIEAFSTAALRAQVTGFDGVEIHGAHYYLISQFLSPLTNTRTDAWGGNVRNRARFATEVIRAVRRSVGSDYPIFVRLNAEERFEQGLPSRDIVEIAKLLVAAGADVLDASGIGQASVGTWEGGTFLNPTSALPKAAAPGDFASAAGRIRAAAHVPVIAVGKLGFPGVAQGVLDAGHADLIALGRQVIADPQSPRKILEGADGGVVRCKECMSCFASIRQGSIRCAVNQELRLIDQVQA